MLQLSYTLVPKNKIFSSYFSTKMITDISIGQGGGGEVTARADLWPVATVFKKIPGCRCERFFKTGFPEHPFSFEDSGSGCYNIGGLRL